MLAMSIGPEVLVTVGTSLVAHLILFFSFRWFLSALIFGETYSSLDSYNKLRWNERTIAFLHAIVSFQGAVRGLIGMLPATLTVDSLADLACTRAAVGPSDNQRLAEFYLCVTLGYFVYDTVIYGTVARHHGVADWLHHVVSECQYATHLSMRWAYLVPIALQTNEVSTPFLHLSWFLSTSLGKRMPLLQAIVQLLFAALFFLSRVLFDLVLTYVPFIVLRRGSCPLEIPLPAKLFSLVSFILYVSVQLLWFGKIVYKLHGLFIRGEDTHKKKEEKATHGTPKPKAS